MTSTFHGLETARRALSTYQTALRTTGHNIANANTPGYSRQRVNLKTTEPFPSPAFNAPKIPGQIGTGVKAGEVERIRQAFLDIQFREENNKYGYWGARARALEKMEDILNEPTEDGIANMLDRFWQSLQDLSVHPEDSGARSVVRQRGIALAETFNYTFNSLEAIRNDYRSEINVQADRINSLTRQINEINKQIAALEPHGYLANDLYDQRDLLVDELANYVNIKVENVSSGGLAKEIAPGRYTIKLLDENGYDLGYTLVDGSRLIANEISVKFDESDDSKKLVEEIQIGNHSLSIEQFTSPGEFWATIEAYGYKDSAGNERGLYPEMQNELDVMVATFIDAFNAVHREGWSLSEIEAGEKANDGAGFNFFDFDPDNPAKTLRVHDDIIRSLDNIAAAAEILENGEATAYPGDGSNALRLANVKDMELNFGGDSTTNVQSFYQGVIGDMAVNTNEAERMTRNTMTLRDSVEDRRQSISGVSLDEEMTDMIKFQHAYNAAARNITMIDEMLDRIINGMGIVGR